MGAEVPRDADISLMQAEVYATVDDEVDLPEFSGRTIIAQIATTGGL